MVRSCIRISYRRRVLLRFAESGRLAEHMNRTRKAGRERLEAALSACEKHLPVGTSLTRPEGGMSIWVRLPEPLDTVELLPGRNAKVFRMCLGSILPSGRTMREHFDSASEGCLQS